MNMSGSAHKGTRSLCSDARRHFPRGRFWQDAPDVGGPGERLWGCSDGREGEDPCSKERDQKGVTGRGVPRKAAPSGEARSGRQTSLTGLQISCRGPPSPDLILKPARGAVLAHSCYCTQGVGDTVSMWS